jgi:hypothetical protein
LIEEAPAVVECATPFALRHVWWLLAIQPRPGVEIDGRDAIGEAGAFFDRGFVFVGRRTIGGLFTCGITVFPFIILRA